MAPAPDSPSPDSEISIIPKIFACPQPFLTSSLFKGWVVSRRSSNIQYFISEENVGDRRITAARRLLQEKPYLRAGQLAPLVGLSTSGLEHLFKIETGMSIGTYAKKIQLERAGHLLLTTHRSLKEIRHEVGIPNASNFLRHFKEWFGKSPSTYRKQHQSRIDVQTAD